MYHILSQTAVCSCTLLLRQQQQHSLYIHHTYQHAKYTYGVLCAAVSKNITTTQTNDNTPWAGDVRVGIVHAHPLQQQRIMYSGKGHTLKTAQILTIVTHMYNTAAVNGVCDSATLTIIRFIVLQHTEKYVVTYLDVTPKLLRHTVKVHGRRCHHHLRVGGDVGSVQDTHELIHLTGKSKAQQTTTTTTRDTYMPRRCGS